MVHIKTLILLFVLSLLLLIFHYVGIQSYFYWSIGWYDVVSHLLGGIIVGLATVLLFRKSKITINPYLYGAGVALLVVIIWEVFEFHAGLTFASSKYALDTTLDILFGFLGANIAVALSFKK